MFSQTTINSCVKSSTCIKDELSKNQPPFTNTYELFEWCADKYKNLDALYFQHNATIDSPVDKYTYKELFQKITQTANLFYSLTETLPVVSYLLPNLPQTHFTLWGAEASGVANAINPFLEVTKIVDILTATKSNILVTVAPELNVELWKKAVSVVKKSPFLEHILVVGVTEICDDIRKQVDIPVISFDTVLNEQNKFTLDSQKTILPIDIAGYFHTGGTTGTPKIAQHSHANQIANAWSLSQFYPGNVGDICLVGLPLFHVNAAIGTGLAAFMKGNIVVLLTPDGYRTPNVINNFWQYINKYQATVFSCVPTILTALLESPMRGVDISSLQFAICGAAPLSQQLITNFEKATGAIILESYGLTEASCISTLNPIKGNRKVGSIGVCLPGQQVKIVKLDVDGCIAKECEMDMTGTLLIKGENVFSGYLNSTSNSGVLLDDGWLNTGDLARIDEDGFIWLTGREKDLIIRSGHNIDPSIIEETLMSHKSVTGVAAIGQPDAYSGELPCAYITLAPEATVTISELKVFTRKNIPERAAIPVYIEVVDSLPVTAVGKIFKPTLRLKAIQRVISGLFEEARIKVSIEVKQSDKSGIIVEINSKENIELINKVMQAITYHFNVIDTH